MLSRVALIPLEKYCMHLKNSCVTVGPCPSNLKPGACNRCLISYMTIDHYWVLFQLAVGGMTCLLWAASCFYVWAGHCEQILAYGFRRVLSTSFVRLSLGAAQTPFVDLTCALRMPSGLRCCAIFCIILVAQAFLSFWRLSFLLLGACAAPFVTLWVGLVQCFSAFAIHVQDRTSSSILSHVTLASGDTVV